MRNSYRVTEKCMLCTCRAARVGIVGILACVAFVICDDYSDCGNGY